MNESVREWVSMRVDESASQSVSAWAGVCLSEGVNGRVSVVKWSEVVWSGVGGWSECVTEGVRGSMIE